MLFCLNDLNEVSYATLLAMGRLEDCRMKFPTLKSLFLSTMPRKHVFPPLSKVFTSDYQVLKPCDMISMNLATLLYWLLKD